MASTNIRPWQRDFFHSLSNGTLNNIALFSCFLNGEPTAAIVDITTCDDPETPIRITPLFVAVTPGMKLVDHDDVQPTEYVCPAA